MNLQQRLITDTLKNIVPHLKSSICFDMGSEQFYTDNKIKLNKDQLKLPYTNNWFQYVVTTPYNKTVKSGINIMEGNFNLNNKTYTYIVTSYSFTGTINHWMLASCSLFNNDWSESCVYSSLPNTDELSKDITGANLNIIFKFLSMLNCSNVIKIRNEPSEKLQKARRIKGKSTLFSYYTLELDLNSKYSKIEYQGGTHTSPRLHLRRGHARQYAEGRYCWVQPCVVGSNHGMIHKDYAINQAAA